MAQPESASDLLSFIREETFNERKAEFVHASLTEFFSPTVLSALRHTEEIYYLVEVAVFAWNVNDQIKKRKCGILAKREPVFEWIKETIISCGVSNSASVLERIGYCVSLGRLNYLKRHSEVRTLRDIIRVADARGNVHCDYEKITKRVTSCFDEIMWFYRENDSIQESILVSILLEQFPLCFLDKIDDKVLHRVSLFLLFVWIKINPPFQNEIGEIFYPMAEQLTNDERECSRITGIVLDYVLNNNLLFRAVTDRDFDLGLLSEALEKIRTQSDIEDERK
ncbi:hypothetical protein EIN_375210 [Entamoeba invadens IP1]|uniref:Uncharacterized protein n=1 Tax=Entamoeba invadens IP1 TaxID=370355 RepID=A0A0A1TY52_ENTIV|nr:hypothetical protein EIN_375210 [Entamoeba invadens IP1]ELP83436.1 hypothetical protein EIN_375210 [Entamoeba invadens IP1]|eukprot:XP_004182782.1 hypothetical protein EIN_375210 [Entamoeba invadens IP1]